jgi:glycosyltransferase involved in cell wall biosynthesis
MSEGVQRVLLDMGMPPERTIAIPTGSACAVRRADAHPIATRIPGIVMVARFSKQKDHATLLRAVALLRERGLAPPVLFAGGGKAMHRKPLETLASELGIDRRCRSSASRATCPSC